MANYTTAAAAAAQYGIETSKITPAMLDAADAQIEEYTREAYKGASVVRVLDGNGAAVLPVWLWPFDRAQTMTCTTTDRFGNSNTLAAGTYHVHADKLLRVDGNLWLPGSRNITLTYRQPSTPPAIWPFVAQLLAGQLALWADKFGTSSLGLAIARSTTEAGITSTTRFPASLSEEVAKILKLHLRPWEPRAQSFVLPGPQWRGVPDLSGTWGGNWPEY